MNPVLINGVPATTLDSGDRGLNYGDGVFETMRVQHGRIRLEQFHRQRLALGLKRLGIAPPSERSLLRELRAVATRLESGVLKLVVTRGSGSRGYRPTGRERTTRILSTSPAPAALDEAKPTRLRVCTLILGEQPALAGIKSLNRLESVLARREWRDAAIFDGLMRDSSGNLVCGTMSNLFLRRHQQLSTPSLERCGVKGVMRRWVMENAARAGFAVLERPIRWADLRAAEEVFVSNALVGLKSVKAIEWRSRGLNLRFDRFDAAQRLREHLARL